jgi:hypothetical protein
MPAISLPSSVIGIAIEIGKPSSGPGAGVWLDVEVLAAGVFVVAAGVSALAAGAEIPAQSLFLLLV